MLSKRLILNSKDRDPFTSRSSTEFTVSLHDQDLTAVKMLTVESVSVSNLVYNVNETNNVLDWEEDGGSIAHGPQTLAVGQYDIDDFIVLLQTLLNTTGTSTFQVTQETHTQKLKITNTSTTFEFKYATSTAFKLIGFAEQDLTSVKESGVDVLYANYTPDLGGVDKLYIHSKTLAESNTISSSVGSASVLTYISFSDTPFGNSNTRYINDERLEMVTYSTPRTLNRIDMKVRDESGNIVDLNNSNVVVILKIYY